MAECPNDVFQVAAAHMQSDCLSRPVIVSCLYEQVVFSIFFIRKHYCWKWIYLEVALPEVLYHLSYPELYQLLFVVHVIFCIVLNIFTFVLQQFLE